MNHLQHWRQPEYTKRLTAKQRQVEAEQSAKNLPKSGDDFLPLPSTSTAIPRVDVAEPKVKVKTKGVAGDVGDVDEVQEDASPDVEQNVTPTVQLTKKKSLTTFHAVYPSTPEDHQRKIERSLFVASMQDAGFAISNNGGSIVNFDHLHSKQKVVIHRPHPETIIDSDHFHFIAQRPNERVQWVREWFVLIRQVTQPLTLQKREI